MKTSAYLSVFDDFELLGPAMASIAPRVDEIVVVDGAYRWMAPFFAALGRDPTRSEDGVRQALAPYGDKLRWINGLWDNELEKRAAGYAACAHRYVYRLDADEIHFFNDAALERFFAGGYAVGQAENPIYVAPGLIQGTIGRPIERNSLLFDRAQIDAHSHLAYLWLVLPELERLRIASLEPAYIAPDAIAFTAHLTSWRPPSSASTRARFYVMNYLREHSGARPKALFRYDEQAGFAPVFDKITPRALMDTLLGHPIITGLPNLAENALIPTPLSPEQDASLGPFYTQFLDGLATLNAAMTQQPRTVMSGDDYHIDLTTPGAAEPFERQGVLHFAYAEDIAAARAILSTLRSDAPFMIETQLPTAIRGGRVLVKLPPPDAEPMLRRVIRLAAWPAKGEAVLRLRAGK